MTEEVKVEETNPAPYQPRNEFDSPEYKKDVEGKLKPLDIEELLTKGKLTQEVTVGKNLRVVFATIETGPDAIIDKIAFEYSNKGEVYLKTVFALQLAASMVTFNGLSLGKALVEYSLEREKEYEEVLRDRFARIRTLNLKIVSLLYINYLWFNERVSQFMKDEFVGKFENF